MPKAPPPSRLLQFHGRRDWPIEPGLDDWGLTGEQQESYVEQFRMLLEAKGKYNEDEHDFFTLRRFLRARTYDLERAMDMFLAHLEWQKEWKTATILTEFKFQQRDAFIASYPQGYHKVDKLGRPVFVQLLGKIDITKLKKVCSEEDMIRFHIQEYERCRRVILPICSRLADRHLDQTFGIMDVSGVGLSHLTGEVKRMMQLVTKYDQNNFPEMLGKIFIINAPYIFRTLWNMVKGFIDPRTQSKIEIVGTDYTAALLKWVDKENLMEMFGGTSKGALVDDCGPWSDEPLLRSIGVDIERLTAGGKSLSALPPPSVLRTVSLTAASHAHLVRSGSDVSEGFYSITGSIDAGFKRHSGVSQVVAEEVAQRYAASLSTTSSNAQHVEGGLHGHAHGELDLTVQEETQQPAGQTLITRIAALEKSLKPYLQRMKQHTGDTDVGNGLTSVTAPAGPHASLVKRVDVLEEALTALVEAQQAMLSTQQQELEAPPQPAPATQPGCCCVQ